MLVLDPVAAATQARGLPQMLVRAWFLPNGGRMESSGRVRHWKRGKLKAKVPGLAFYRQESRVTALDTNPHHSVRAL